ncbi:erythromycin esterase family protein [Adhaeribacter soli]|uniref:Erythromycin esterase family protein n=1 Tax=Adhaeribacter soli TaxID=2607655 RepID=A0A5N1J3A0_9BACT|nr:erythromycin esterase family protein [Adhaeribacter soli]KAA9340575.1 erythromycin esterase family protein [Adhaeribacter soli]
MKKVYQKPFRHYLLEDAQSLNPLMEAIGDSRVVMLGEASHGTSEYYTWRTAISKRLIQEKGFNFIAVEGDWPDSFLVNRYVKGYSDGSNTVHKLLQNFNRWPTWMWGNWEVAALVEWLKENNQTKPVSKKIGFYGLDVYSLWESLEEILSYVEAKDPELVTAARKVVNCFEPFNNDPEEYARAVAFVPQDCEEEVLDLLTRIREKAAALDKENEAQFSTEQNALVTVNAEKYYRAMVKGGSNSWNVRDEHMVETLNRLLQFHGPEAKAIIWEHNTHIGDARFTDMARSRMLNVGQLVREQHGRDKVFAVGFGSYKGSVIAGKSWGAPMQKMDVPEAQRGSWEHFLHEISPEDKLILSKDLKHVPELRDTIGHRAIGVVYDPKTERFGNYVPSVVPERYDAFMFIDETEALHPLHTPLATNAPPDLYPWTF